MKRVLMRALCLAAILFAPALACAATLSLSPAARAVHVGDVFSETVLVSSPDEAVNAVAGTLSFPANLLSVVSVSKSGSALSLWLEDPSYENAAGTVNWSGAAPNPGITGNGRAVLTVTFRANAAGAAQISFADGGQVLANDGSGTQVLSGTAGAAVSIAAAAPPPQPAPASAPASADANASAQTGPLVITSPTDPDQNAWYASTTAQFSWVNPPGTTAVRLGYDASPDEPPAVVYEPPVAEKTLALPEGTTYFSAQAKTAAGWGPVATYRVNIDATPPRPFAVQLVSQEGGPLSAVFSAEDDRSGIDHYEVSVGGARPVSLAPPSALAPVAYSLASLPEGTTTIVVAAYDRAGNAASAAQTFYAPKPRAGFSLPPFAAVLVRSLAYAAAAAAALLILLVVAGALAFSAWSLLHYLRAYRRRLSRAMLARDRALKSELLSFHRTLEAEAARLRREESSENLSLEEKRFLKRLDKLIAKTERALADGF